MFTLMTNYIWIWSSIECQDQPIAVDPTSLHRHCSIQLILPILSNIRPWIRMNAIIDIQWWPLSRLRSKTNLITIKLESKTTISKFTLKVAWSRSFRETPTMYKLLKHNDGPSTYDDYLIHLSHNLDQQEPTRDQWPTFFQIETRRGITKLATPFWGAKYHQNLDQGIITQLYAHLSPNTGTMWSNEWSHLLTNGPSIGHNHMCAWNPKVGTETHPQTRSVVVPQGGGLGSRWLRPLRESFQLYNLVRNKWPIFVDSWSSPLN